MKNSKQEIRIRECRGIPGICTASRVQARSEGTNEEINSKGNSSGERFSRGSSTREKVRELAGRVTAHFGFRGQGTGFLAIQRIQRGRAGARGSAGN